MGLYPNGRGNGLRSHRVWVRIPGGLPKMTRSAYCAPFFIEAFRSFQDAPGCIGKAMARKRCKTLQKAPDG